MTRNLFFKIFIIFILTHSLKSFATHGLPLVNFSYVVGTTGVTVSGTSDASTCGSGPYWMQVEIGCTPGALTGVPPAAMQTTLQNWPCVGGANTFNQFPWYNSTQNIPDRCNDGCVTGEQYNNVFVPFTNLCPGQTYYFAAREWVGGSNSPGPFTATFSFVVPGVFVPLSFNVNASPATYCAPGSSTLTATGVTGGCGIISYLWSPGGSTAASLVVSPGTTTTYNCTVQTPCNTLTKPVTVTVVSSLSAAFTPLNTSICQGASQVFTHTGTAGVTHNWGVSPVTGVTITSPSSVNPSIAFATAGTYVVSHTVTAGSCVNVVTTSITVDNVTSTFTVPSATQCFTGNSFNFNNTGTAGGTHSYSFSPVAGAPAVGSTGNYSGSFNAPGNYVVTQNVASGGCSSSTTMAVIVNPNPSATLTFTNPSCGNSNGSIFITNTSSGGQTITGFTSSSGTVSGQTVSGLGAGTTIITLTNNFSCTFTVSATLSNTPPITDVALTPNNIICGTGFGSITIGAVTGGVATYSYNVNGGPFTTSPPVTGLTSAVYTIGVKDINGCTFTKTVAITVTPGPTALTNITTPAGCGMINGTNNITGVTGGSPIYTFSINGVSTPSLTTGLAAGAYTLLVKDGNGCTFTKTISVGGGTGPTSATITTTNASCGTANGSSTITGVTGGAPAYSYSFDGGPFITSTSTLNLGAGAHTIIIKDAGTCTLTVPYNVANNGSPTISLTASANVLCNGGSTGSFTVLATGGSGAPFTYTLTSPFQVNGNGQFTNLPAGNYTVNAADAAGCLVNIPLSLTQPPALTLNPTALPAKCFGTATGTINVTGSGGTPSYSFQVNGTGFQASGAFNTVSAGTPVIQIKDANGCTATQTISVTQPPALALTVSSQNANCTASNGVASGTVTGGTFPYTYIWSGAGGSNPLTGGLPSGSYTLTSTDNAGCTITAVSIIGNTPGGTAAITGSTNITCNGANNGILTAGMVSGGTNPLSYSWTPSGQLTATAINLAPGTYTCKITDLFGCIATATATLTQPAALTSLMSSSSVKCFGSSTGTVTAAGGGGTIPYTYSWVNLPGTSPTVPNVAIGTYTANITDANNCVIHPTVTVTQPSSITISNTVTPANCGLSNGSASITISGGTPSYTQTWSAGSTTTVQNSIQAGTYNITIKDINNCTSVVAVTVPNLSGPSISITSFTNVSCFGGSNAGATSAGIGGTGALTYQWNTGHVTPTATNFLAGVHTVTVTDATGCIASASVNITQPTALSVSITATQPKCFGAANGSGTGTPFGGTPGYTYTWTVGGSGATTTPLLAGTYALTISDAKGCIATASMSLVNPPAMVASITSTNNTCFNSCNGVAVGSAINNTGVVTYYWIGGPGPVTSQTVTGLCAGTYTLTGTDQNNCTASAQVIITQPAQVTANITSSGTVTCNGGSNGFAQVTAGGGTGAYSYTWSATTPATAVTAAAAAGNNANANNLPAGIYTVTVKDANLCSVTTQVTIIQPAPLATTLTTTNPKCFGTCDGTGALGITGGSGTSIVSWLPGLQSGLSVNNLCTGPNTVTITYNNTCPTTLTFTLTQPPVLTAVVSATASNCGNANGAATATVSGGTGPFTYLWSTSPTATGLNNANILAGPHTFTVTDFNLCKVQATALVNDIAAPTVVVTGTTAVKCFGGNDGAATTMIAGGVFPYTIQWISHPAITQNVTNFPAGNYSIKVTDAANCVGTASLIISQPTQLNSAINTHTDVICFGQTNGQAVMSVTGGTGSYTYSWSPSGQTSAIMAGVGANTYTCVAKDANNCPASQVVTITQPTQIVMTSSSTDVSCFGYNNGQITTSVSGGMPNHTFVWTPAQGNSPSISGLAPGNYGVVVTDANNCPITANFNIAEPSALASSYVSSPAKCNLANGSATVTVTPGTGTPSYTLNWNAGAQQGPVATNMGPGNWTCTIIDSKGCTKVQAVTVANALPPVMTNSLITPPTCFAGMNGSIEIFYAQGTPNYTINWASPINPATQVTSALSQTITGVGAGAYTFTITDSYGCTLPWGIVVPPQQQIYWLPVISPTICYGQTVQISANAGGGTGALTYNWSTPITANTAGPHSVSPLVTTVYNVNVMDANNCVITPTMVTVNVTPQLLVVGGPYTVCAGRSAVLTPTFTSPGQGPPYNFTWSNGVTENAVSNSSITVTGTLPGPNNYTLTVSDGCPGPSLTTTFTVNVNPLPAIDFTSPAEGCAPLIVTLNGISNNPGNEFTWQDNIHHGIGEGSSITYTYPDSGKYSISVHVYNPTTQCSNDLTKTDYVIVHPKPVASFVANPTSTSILDPLINFTNTSSGASTYLWDFGDAGATGGSNNATTFNASHSYSYVGPYNVNLVATSSHGCVDVKLISVEITPDFALYIPNTFTPDGNGVNDFFQPVGVGINEDNYRMDVFDRWGETIFTSNNFRKGWDGSVKGSGKLAEQGVYVYKLMVFDLQGNKHPFVGHVTVLRAN